MSQRPQFCCTTHPTPTSAPNSHLLSSFLCALFTILPRQLPPPPTPSSSQPTLFPNSSNLASNSSAYFSARFQPLLPSPSTEKGLFPPFPDIIPLPRTIVEFETIHSANKHTRHFSHRYYTEFPGRSWHEIQMFPEESFREVDWERVEQRWRRGQGYMNKMDEEGDNWVGGWATMWVSRDDAGHRGKYRVGWNCGVHGWGYWVRLISWDDENEDRDEDDDGRRSIHR